MFSVRLDYHLYGKWLLNWLSLVMSLMVSYFVLPFFPRDVLDEIWVELSQFLRISYLLFHMHIGQKCYFSNASDKN